MIEMSALVKCTWVEMACSAIYCEAWFTWRGSYACFLVCVSACVSVFVSHWDFEEIGGLQKNLHTMMGIFLTLFLKLIYLGKYG